MGIPAIVQHQGVVSGVCAPGSQPGALTEIMNTCFTGTYGSSKSARPTLVNFTQGSPMTLPLEGISKVRFFAAKARGGSLRLMLTSALGSDQLVPLGSGSLFMMHDPAPGDELTAIKVFGTGDLEYVLAGDA